MSELDLAYQHIENDEIDLARKIYLKIYQSNESSQDDKVEAALQLGYIFSGDFDDSDSSVQFKNVQLAKNYFRFAHSRGKKEGTLGFALLAGPDIASTIDDVEFSINFLLSKAYEQKYKDELLKTLSNYVKKTVNNNQNKLLNVYERLDEYQTKSKVKEVVDLLSSNKKEIALLISDILLANINSVSDCYKAKNLLFQVNVDNVVGDAIGKINTEIVQIQLDNFDDIGSEERIRKDIKRFDRRESYETYNLLNDELNIILAVSYAYGRNKATINYSTAKKYFSLVQCSALLNILDSQLEELAGYLISTEDYDKAKTFASLIHSTNIRARIKIFINKKDEAVKFLKVLEKANMNDKDAKYTLATYYETGFGVEADKDRAIDIYKELFYGGHSVEAFYKLAELLENNELKTILVDARKLGYSFNNQQYSKFSIFEKQVESKVETAATDNSSFKCMSVEERKQLEEELKRRGITYLLHFTDESNLPSIRNVGGILSIQRLRQLKGIKYTNTDYDRLDGEPNGISVSITNPNKYMLDLKIDGGVIKSPYIIFIKSSLLLDPNIRFIFCERNAAKRINNKGSSFKDFLKMFQKDKPISFTSKTGIEYSMTREELRRRPNEPTDAQAEILVEGEIPLAYILGTQKYRRGSY